jgi:hypothetical protein
MVAYLVKTASSVDDSVARAIGESKMNKTRLFLGPIKVNQVTELSNQDHLMQTVFFLFSEHHESVKNMRGLQMAQTSA